MLQKCHNRVACQTSFSKFAKNNLQKCCKSGATNLQILCKKLAKMLQQMLQQIVCQTTFSKFAKKTCKNVAKVVQLICKYCARNLQICCKNVATELFAKLLSANLQKTTWKNVAKMLKNWCKMVQKCCKNGAKMSQQYYTLLTGTLLTPRLTPGNLIQLHFKSVLKRENSKKPLNT